ncbi:MAG: extracellular solute-binding protein [Lachnospiraceae bacterium]|nr:extracellular solute-binding protein [Lachnospiraceae bacterium]
MKKKLISVWMSAAMVCGFLTGCGQNTDTQQTAGENTEASVEASAGQEGLESGDITLSIWAGEEDKDLIAAIADQFVAEHADEANITIEWSPMVEGECRSNLLGDILNAPDVYTTTDGDLRSIVAGGGASPVINPDEIKAENLEAAVAALTINDTIYGYPITADNGYFLYYNTAYLTAEDVQSLDRILEVAAENGKTFDMNWESGWYLYSFFGQTGLKVGLNDDGVTNFCDWNSTENAIKGVDVAESLLAIGANPGFKNTEDWLTDAQEDTCIALVSGVWDASAIKAIWGDNYAAAKLPTYTCAGQQVQMACYFGYKMIGVNPYSEHETWAHELAKYISNEENQKLRFEMRGQGPSNINAGQSEAVKQDMVIQAVLAQSAYSEPQRLGGNFWTPSMNLGIACDTGEIGDVTLQELLDNTVAEITASSVQ